jgi:hypothetical protein
MNTWRSLGVGVGMLVTTVAAQAQVDYATQVQPIFDARCSCHFPSFSGWDPSTYATVMASVGSQYKTNIVQPGNSAASPLYDKIASASPNFGQRMPRGGPYLSAAEITTIKNWINEGARQKVGATIVQHTFSGPDKFALSQNYPNPFNPSTRIRFSIADKRFVTLRVFDVLGHEAASLVNRTLDAGAYTVEWNAAHAASGLYFYQLRAADPTGVSGNIFVETKKLVVQK